MSSSSRHKMQSLRICSLCACQNYLVVLGLRSPVEKGAGRWNPLEDK